MTDGPTGNGLTDGPQTTHQSTYRHEGSKGSYTPKKGVENA